MSTNGVEDLNPAVDECASYAMATNIPGVNPTLTQQRIEPNRPTGVVAPGRVENYSPVTDAMLTNPSPNDWLMLLDEFNSEKLDSFIINFKSSISCLKKSN